MDDTHTIEEVLGYLDKLNKKIDKLTNIVTKMGKTLHLVPVTEAEERSIQILQRSNLATAAKVSSELDAMAPPPEREIPEMLSIFDSFDNPELFKDVLGDDYLGGTSNG